MPQTSPELYDKLRAIVQATFDAGPDPWNTVVVDHGDVRSYCEDLVEGDGFVIDGGWMAIPDKYGGKDFPENVNDALIYLIEEWDFALGEKPAFVPQIRVYPMFDDDEEEDEEDD